MSKFINSQQLSKERERGDCLTLSLEEVDSAGQQRWLTVKST
jgi:hypothetical protein